jgi:hypothetical protein
MITWLKRYWIELLVIVSIFGVLLNDLSVGLTWVNTDSDGAHYLLACKYMLPAHNTSAPLFLLIGRLFLFLPFGTEPWRLGLISVLATTGSCALIYLIVKRLLYGKSKSRWYALIASIIYGGSALAISQSTIIETYALSTCLMLLAYYLSMKSKWVLTAIVIGLLWATHTLFAWIIWAILLIKYKELRSIPLALLTLLFLGFYLYIPISTAVNGDLGMWGNTSVSGFLQNNVGVFLMLSGGLSMWDMPKRIIDTISMMGVSLGFGTIIIIWYFIKGKTWRNHLLWLFLIPVIWFAINLSPETYVYLLPAVAFGAVITGLGLSKIKWQYALITAIIAVGLWGYNGWYFDIGKQLDPEMSAEKFYHEELAKIPDGEIFMGGGWTWAMVFLYNKEEGRNIIPVSWDIFPSDKYLDIIEAQGIKLVRSDDKNQINIQGEVGLSIAELNDGVWIAKETKPEVYQYVIEPARGNEDYITRWVGETIEPGNWQWKPSNPWKFIDGSLEVSSWHHILWSSKNAFYVISLGIFGWFFIWVAFRYAKKLKDKKKIKNEVVEK